MKHRKKAIALTLTLFLSASKLLFAQNPVVVENALPGNPMSEWTVPDFRETRINGFATSISVNKGTTVSFKIHSQSGTSYTLKIYRLGYYGGDGARLQANLGTIAGTAQPAGLYTAATGLLDCRNWSVSASWSVPSTAVSGIYIAKVVRTSGDAASNHILFVVRDDSRNADIIMSTSDATWQAYNGYGGNYFYNGTVAGYTNGRAVKVSYNRPFFPYNAAFQANNRQSDWYMNAEFPLLRWLERNGFDVAYLTCVDASRQASLLLNHKVYVITGHDEYVSKEQRDNVTAARNAGVNCIFLTGNEIYWKTRWEADGAGNTFRTLVCYKDGTMGDGSVDEASCGNKCDPLATVWTGQWRTGAAYDAPFPENELTGTIGWVEIPDSITVPADYSYHRFWRNTAVANLTGNQTVKMPAGSLGYEWDYEQYLSSNPAGRMKLSHNNIAHRDHHLILYRHSSGALVFGAGSIQFAWALDSVHYGGTSNRASQDMQQAMVNLLADMSTQPGSLQANLVAATKSTDVTPPVTTLSFPTNGAVLLTGAPVSIAGTTTDNAAVSVVEVSVDNGTTWSPAVGRNNWTFTWTPPANGTYTIKVRGWDDTGNKEVPGVVPASNAVTITVVAPSTPVCPCTVFSSSQAIQPSILPSVNDGQAIQLGMKFRASENGFVTGARYYKSTNNTGTHTGQLYDRNGNLLASAVYNNETVNGWQTVNFSTPVYIKKDTTYIISYHSPDGFFLNKFDYFADAITNGPLTGLMDGTDGQNGTYKYTASPAYPNNTTTNRSNYWVDVVFSQASNTWTGVVNSAWENPQNWSAGMVPSAQSLVVVPSGRPNNPVVNSNVTVKALQVNTGATITVVTGFKITVQ